MDLISLRCVSVKWSTKFSHQSRQQPRVQKVWSQERHVRRNGMSDANHQPARLIFRCACHEEAAALNKLDWDELLGSVAQFARTEAGLNAVRSMAIPTTREETLERMAATQAVERYSCQLNLTVDLSGAETRLAHEALQALNSEAVASGQQLVGMITCMLCAQKVEKDMAAAHRMRPTLLEEWSIRPLVAKFSKVPAADEFILEAGRVLDVEGDVKATATEETAHWTAVVEDWEDELVTSLNRCYPGWQVQVYKGRVCVSKPVEDVQTKSERVLKSRGRACLVEPTSISDGNGELVNARARLKDAEREALKGLCDMARPLAHSFSECLDKIVWADVAQACALYGVWTDGVLPFFSNIPTEQQALRGTYLSSKADDDVATYTVRLRRVRHPLLLARYLTLQHTFKQQQRLLKLASEGRLPSTQQSQLPANRNIIQIGDLVEPVPVDFAVQRGVKGVVITGPNTGGKTAALKCLGLVALMAKCGIPVPSRPTVLLPWFSQVFADIGDEQSLTSSLSTFSGHLARVQAILERQGGDSLLLLDEVGTGTDPLEGAALGMALLQRVVGDGHGTAALVMATTHHSALTNLRSRDPRFENASVEFDEERLRPTYRMQWGVPGRSNAINIAERLGLDAAVVGRAREMWGRSQGDIELRVQELERVQREHDTVVKARDEVAEQRQIVEQDLMAARLRVLQRTAQQRIHHLQALRSSLYAGREALAQYRQHLTEKLAEQQREDERKAKREKRLEEIRKRGGFPQQRNQPAGKKVSPMRKLFDDALSKAEHASTTPKQHSVTSYQNQPSGTLSQQNANTPPSTIQSPRKQPTTLHAAQKSRLSQPVPTGTKAMGAVLQNALRDRGVDNQAWESPSQDSLDVMLQTRGMSGASSQSLPNKTDNDVSFPQAYMDQDRATSSQVEKPSPNLSVGLQVVVVDLQLVGQIVAIEGQRVKVRAGLGGMVIGVDRDNVKCL